MILAKTVYDACLALIKKDQRGSSFSIEEYNTIAPLVNEELYNYYINRYENGVAVGDALLRLKLRSQTLALTAGKAWLHPNADRLAGLPVIAYPSAPITAVTEVDVVNNPDSKIKITSAGHGLKEGDIINGSGLAVHTIDAEPIHYIDKDSFWVDVDYIGAETLTNAYWILSGYEYREVDLVTEQELAVRQYDPLKKPTVHHPVAVLDVGDPVGWISASFIPEVSNSGHYISAYYNTATGEYLGNERLAIVFVVPATNDADPPIMPLGLKTGDIITIYGGTDGFGVARTVYNGHHRVVRLNISIPTSDPTSPNEVVYLPDQAFNTAESEPTFMYFKVYDRKRINVYPTTIQSVRVNYIMHPVTPFLDYYVNDTSYAITYLDKEQRLTDFAAGYTYRDGTEGDGVMDIVSVTEDWEWDQDQLPQIVYMILQKAGINLENLSVAQIATQLQTKEESQI